MYDERNAMHTAARQLHIRKKELIRRQEQINEERDGFIQKLRAIDDSYYLQLLKPGYQVGLRAEHALFQERQQVLQAIEKQERLALNKAKQLEADWKEFNADSRLLHEKLLPFMSIDSSHI